MSCLNFLKKTVYYISFLCLLAAIAGLIVSIIYLAKGSDNEFFNYSDYDWNVVGFSLLLAFSIVMLILSIFGLVGGKKQYRSCLCIYNIGILPLALMFLALAIYFNIYLNGFLNDFDTTTCTTSHKSLAWIQNANEGSLEAYLVFGNSEGFAIHTDSGAP